MRIAPVNPPYAPNVQALFDRLPADWSPPFSLFTVLARDERLLLRFTGSAVSYLTPRQREVFLLRVTGRCKNAFEWCLRVHYVADEVGLDMIQLRSSVHGSADDPCWAPGDRLLIRLADELHETASIGDVLWHELRVEFSEEGILQLILMAGHYRTNGYVTSGLRIPVEPRVKLTFPES